RDGDEPPKDNQGNEQGQQERKCQHRQNHTDQDKEPQHDDANSREDKHQENCCTKKSDQRDDQSPRPDHALQWSGHLLSVDYDCYGIAPAAQPPRNYYEHKYHKSNCQFLCHKHFLSLPSNASMLRDASLASIPLQRMVSPRSTSAATCA